MHWIWSTIQPVISKEDLNYSYLVYIVIPHLSSEYLYNYYPKTVDIKLV
jgi:hypothetical protein